ncbi:conserved hypothetical protein [Ricinus communis]|uniref:Uncharacterized protein n=1 Tax=Ricinus communis TaxID=3988 RepID=B9T5T2_RICCO|nr:conserved hypothetical protein [Ricinus communis]
MKDGEHASGVGFSTTQLDDRNTKVITLPPQLYDFQRAAHSTPTAVKLHRSKRKRAWFLG